jgi:exonuclease VII large subunit
MEYNINNLREALAKLPSSGPSDQIWLEIDRKLSEVPLQNALRELPVFEPDEHIWEAIENKVPNRSRTNMTWWYAAAVILVGGITGLWTSKRSTAPVVAYSQEIVDERLQAKKDQETDQQYEKLMAYCEAETMVCNDKNFKRLQQEYEKLQTATQQLQQAMGAYNTEPELIRQFSLVEQEKAEVLNEMAKMI